MSDQPKGPQGITGGLTNYGDPEFARYLRRSFAKSMGYTGKSLDKPIVGICYTESGFNNCHRHFPEMLEAVKRGILAEGVASSLSGYLARRGVSQPDFTRLSQPDGHGD